MKLSRVVFFLFLTACAHSDQLQNNPILPLGSWEPPGQLTFHTGTDYNPTWSADGGHILYSFAPAEIGSPAFRDDRCLAIVPRLGGTRTFTLCDTRGVYADSANMFIGASFRPTGQLAFLQGSSAYLGLNPAHLTMWLVDTVAPLARRVAIAEFPKPVGDSVVGLLRNVVWTDADHFLAIANRFLITGIYQSASRDTVFGPQFMVLGTMNGESAQLARIPGTEGAEHWSLDNNGNILFVRGAVGGNLRLAVIEERTILRVAQSGGVPVTIGTAPVGSSIRALHCRITCLVLTGNRNPNDPNAVTGAALYRFNLMTLAFASLGSPGHNLNTWRTPELSPDGTRVVYASGGNLFVVTIPQ